MNKRCDFFCMVGSLENIRGDLGERHQNLFLFPFLFERGIGLRSLISITDYKTGAF